MTRPRTLSKAERAESLIADIEALPRSRKNVRADAVEVEVVFPISPFSVVRQAAKARRLSLPAFVRRAAYAMACRDLGVPLAEVLALDPRVARENGFGVDDPEGTKFGPWEIVALRGEGDGTES